MPRILLGSPPLFDRLYLGHTKCTHTCIQTINKGNFCSLTSDTEGQTTTCVWHRHLWSVDRHVSMEPSATLGDLKTSPDAGSAAIMIFRFKNQWKSEQEVGVFKQCLATKLNVLKPVLPPSHDVFSLTFELSGSTMITLSHTLTGWTIITATLSVIDKEKNGLVGDIEAPGFLPLWSTKQNHWTLQKLCGSTTRCFEMTSWIPRGLNITVRFWWI